MCGLTYRMNLLFGCPAGMLTVVAAMLTLAAGTTANCAATAMKKLGFSQVETIGGAPPQNCNAEPTNESGL